MVSEILCILPLAYNAPTPYLLKVKASGRFSAGAEEGLSANKRYAKLASCVCFFIEKSKIYGGVRTVYWAGVNFSPLLSRVISSAWGKHCDRLHSVWHPWTFVLELINGRHCMSMTSVRNFLAPLYAQRKALNAPSFAGIAVL